MCCALKFTEREKEFSNNVFKFFLQGGDSAVIEGEVV